MHVGAGGAGDDGAGAAFAIGCGPGAGAGDGAGDEHPPTAASRSAHLISRTRNPTPCGGFIRLSVGIEVLSDLLADLERAFHAAR
jgi:Cys/Met metabolism PLP-dependent enzyme